MTIEPVAVRRPTRPHGGSRRGIIALVAVGVTLAVYVHAWNDVGASFTSLFTSGGNVWDILRRSGWRSPARCVSTRR